MILATGSRTMLHGKKIVVDAEILTQIFCFGYRVGEVISPCNDNGPCLAL